ncbi:hypothetical protein INR49_003046, partial [Caranx melampygus]
MDECSPFGQLDSVSAFVVPTSLDETHALGSEIKDTVNSQQYGHVDCGSSTGPGGTKGTPPLTFKPEEVVLHLAPAFDCDIDDILCLNPVGTHSASRLSEHAQGCKFSRTFQNNAVSVPTLAHGEALGKGAERVKSVVVIPDQQTTNKTGASALSDKMKLRHPHTPDERVSQGVQRVTSQRLMFERKMDWEHVMCELLNLMTNIAGQTSARRTDTQWQHPSDLTKKNYQRRWGNPTPKWTLDEWQEKSTGTGQVASDPGVLWPRFSTRTCAKG